MSTPVPPDYEREVRMMTALIERALGHLDTAYHSAGLSNFSGVEILQAKLLLKEAIGK